MSAAITEFEGDPKEAPPASSRPIAKLKKVSISAPETPNGIRSPLKTPIHSMRSPDDAYNDNEAPRRPNHGRSLSNSSMEEEDHAGGGNGDDAKENSRKRGSIDMPEYPRRRATIAVCSLLPCPAARPLADSCDSVKSVEGASHGATARNPVASFARNSMPNAYIESQVSSSTPAISSYWKG